MNYNKSSKYRNNIKQQNNITIMYYNNKLRQQTTLQVQTGRCRCRGQGHYQGQGHINVSKVPSEVMSLERGNTSRCYNKKSVT